MSKLHEVLAVEADLEGKAKVVIAEAAKVFAKSPGLFNGSVKTYKPFVEDGIEYPSEHQSMATTVPAKLEYVGESIAAWFDVLAQKEATNQIAVADLEVDGKVLAEKVPATLLLGLESRLKAIRAMYVEIPTLLMSTEWQKSPAKGEGVWEAVHPEETFKTAKTMKSMVLYEATDKHPAQIDKWDETINVGKYTKRVWTGMVTPAEKADMLERIDKLIRAVKVARQRANSVEVVKINIGKKIIDFING